MLNDYTIAYISIYIVLELYEVSWQKAPTIMEMLARMYRYYYKNTFLFLIMHPTFYFAIFFAMQTNYNTYALVLFVIKGVDIVTKMLFIKQIFIDKKISRELGEMLLMPIGKYTPYIGLLVYPPLIVLAFS
ncbi:hypothetical protein [Sulfurimonas sp.]